MAKQAKTPTSRSPRNHGRKRSATVAEELAKCLGTSDVVEQIETINGWLRERRHQRTLEPLSAKPEVADRALADGSSQWGVYKQADRSADLAYLVERLGREDLAQEVVRLLRRIEKRRGRFRLLPPFAFRREDGSMRLCGSKTAYFSLIQLEEDYGAKVLVVDEKEYLARPAPPNSRKYYHLYSLLAMQVPIGVFSISELTAYSVGCVNLWLGLPPELCKSESMRQYHHVLRSHAAEMYVFAVRHPRRFIEFFGSLADDALTECAAFWFADNPQAISPEWLKDGAALSTRGKLLMLAKLGPPANMTKRLRRAMTMHMVTAAVAAHLISSGVKLALPTASQQALAHYPFEKVFTLFKELAPKPIVAEDALGLRPIASVREPQWTSIGSDTSTSDLCLGATPGLPSQENSVRRGGGSG